MTHGKRQRNAFERRIRSRIAELKAELRGDVARSREESFAAVAGEVRDAGDQSVADVIADTDQAELGRDLDELRELEAALERLQAGVYGLCEDCGEDIDARRLRVELAARRCVPCQEKRERTYAQPGHPNL
jgi:DnaK suppressor protein